MQRVSPHHMCIHVSCAAHCPLVRSGSTSSAEVHPDTWQGKPCRGFRAGALARPLLSVYLTAEDIPSGTFPDLILAD